MTGTDSPTGMTAAQIEAEAEAFASGLAPFLPPNAAIAVGVATQLLNAVTAAMAQQTDITDAQIVDLLNADNAAKAADAAVQAAVAAKPVG